MLFDNSLAISWKLKKQSSRVLSACEAKYIALSVACPEFSYLTQFLKDVVQCVFASVHVKKR